MQRLNFSRAASRMAGPDVAKRRTRRGRKRMPEWPWNLGLALLLAWLANAVVTAMVARSRGRSPLRWFCLACVSGGYALAAIIKAPRDGAP